MPYIPLVMRDLVEPTTPGELAYAVTRTCLDWVDRQGRRNFLTLALCIGVLVCVVLELYRRVVAPYEDKKIAENGDVKGMA